VTYLGEQFVWSDMAWYRIALLVILLPLLATLWSRYSVDAENVGAARTWLKSRRLARVLRLITLAIWWALWDLQRPSGLTRLSGIVLFWTPPIVSVGISHIIACVTSRTILEQKWRSTDILRLAFWSTVSPTIALLFVATAFEFIYEKRFVGIPWLLIAGIAALIGELRFRAAEGLTLRKVKSGQAYTRAFQLAKKMGVKLERVYVVPAGKGHLTNAYGSARSIAVTDNYGEFLRGSQLDYLIGHELGHVKRKHGIKKLLIVALLFLVPALILLTLPFFPLSSRPIIDLAMMLGLSLAFYSVSRRFEYQADRESVELTGDPKTAVHALANLCRVTDTPVSCGRLVELFLTHPSFRRRAEAIARAGKMDLNGIDEILQHAGLLETSAQTHGR
jgi:Zn-dependent protease with chaperone function